MSVAASTIEPKTVLVDATRLFPDRVSALQRFLASEAAARAKVLVWCDGENQAQTITAGLTNNRINIRFATIPDLPRAMMAELEGCVRAGMSPAAVYTSNGRVRAEFRATAERHPQHFVCVASLGDLVPLSRITPSFAGEVARPHLVADAAPLSDEEIRAFASTMVRALASRLHDPRGPAMNSSELKVLMEAMDPRVPRGKAQLNGYRNFMSRVIDWAIAQGWVRVGVFGNSSPYNRRVELVPSHPEVDRIVSRRDVERTPPSPLAAGEPVVVSSAASSIPSHTTKQGREQSRTRHQAMQSFVRRLKAAGFGPLHGALHKILDAMERLTVKDQQVSALISIAVSRTWQPEWFRYGDAEQLGASVLDILRHGRVVDNGKPDLDTGWRAQLERRMLLAALGDEKVPWPETLYDMSAALYFDAAWKTDRQARSRYAARVSEHVAFLRAHGEVEVGTEGTASEVTFLSAKRLRLAE